MAEVLTGEVLAAIECDRQDYNNWRKRVFLPAAARFPEMTGAREPMSHFAALLVGFTAALVKVGFDPAEAASRAEVYAAKHRAGLTPKWLISFPGTDVEIHCGDLGAEKSIAEAFAAESSGASSKWADAVSLDAVEGKRSHLAARIVNLAEIGARIDQLFARGA